MIKFQKVILEETVNKLKLILIGTVALCLLGCKNPVDKPGENSSDNSGDQQNIETPMLKIEDNILSFTEKFSFDGISNNSKIAVVITNENETWKYAKAFLYDTDFSFNIDNEIFPSVVRGTKNIPVEEKITITILKVNNEWEYICHTGFNYKPNAERIAAFDYSKKSFTPKNMIFTDETAWEASEKMKNGANISNDLDCYVDGLKGLDLPPVIWESNWLAKPVTLENIRYLKSLGFNAIRLPVSWGQHLDSNNNIYASWMNRVQEVVDWCMDEDLYVIINTHHDGGPKPGKDGVEGASWIRATEESYNSNKDLYVKILSQIFDRFKNYSEKLIFANVNEICPGDVIPGDQSVSAISDSSFRAMEKWNQIFVDTVRNSGGNNAKRNISVSSIATSYDEISLSRIQLPNDSAENHLLFEVHCYDPWPFCGDGDECNITEFAKSNFEINHALVPSFGFSQKYNVPVYIGEWGVFDKQNGTQIADEERAKYAEQFISYATKHGLTPFLWLPCNFTGYTSEKDAVHFCPKFIKAIQDNIYPSEYKQVVINETTLELKRDYKWDDSTNALSNTEYDNIGIKLDLTKSFNQLPVEGNTISVSCDLVSNNKLSDLYFYFVDTSPAANNWLKLDGDYGNQGHIQSIEAGTEFTLSYNATLTKSPKGNITLWIYYPKTVLDEEIILSVK